MEQNNKAKNLNHMSKKKNNYNLKCQISNLEIYLNMKMIKKKIKKRKSGEISENLMHKYHSLIKIWNQTIRILQILEILMISNKIKKFN